MKTTNWEEELNEKFPILGLEGEFADELKSFISELLEKEREEVIKIVGGMKKAPIVVEAIKQPYSFGKRIGYNQALSDIIKKIKEL